MKYIRSKDEIEKVPDSYANQLIECPNLVIANTIEELCDMVVYVPKGQYKPTKSFPPLFNIKGINDLYVCLDYVEKYEYELDNFYYGIWTEKGFIYVAKMNDKGELELL